MPSDVEREEVQKLTPREVLRRVHYIELKTKRLVEGLLAGAYDSAFKGRGLEFAEVREYLPGDDIRTIDWKVTARMDSPYIKEFTEERNLVAYILFDISASNEFGYEKSKKEAAIELAATLMIAALRNNDFIGLCLFTDHVEKYIPPRKGRKHVLALIRQLIYSKPKHKGTDIANSLNFLLKIIKKRSVVFIISDFYDNSEFQKPLKHLTFKNDVIAINISDLREKDIPDIGYVRMEDEESGEQLTVNTSDPEFRRKYVYLLEEHNKKLENRIKKLGAGYILVNTNEPFEIPLKKYFAHRAREIVK